MIVVDVMSPILLQGGAAVASLIALLGLLVHLAIIYWVYTDAKRRSEHPAFLWAIVVFLAPLLGLVLYWLLGRE